MSELLSKIAKTSVFKQYIKLPYIIYRKKYLIPQRPLPHQPIQPMSIGPHTTIAQIYLKHFPEVASNPDWERQLCLLNISQFIKLLKNHQKEDKQDYQSQMTAYKEKYLKPIQQYEKRVTPQQLFYQDQRQNILKSLNEQGKKFRINLIQEYYNNIPTNLKQIYQKKSDLITKRIKKKLQPIVSRYRIPELNYYNTLKPFYLNHLQSMSIPVQKRVAYKDLTPEEKDKYIVKLNAYNQKVEQEFNAFLKRYKLTVKKYDKIIDLCQQLTKQLKLNKLSSQQQVIEDMLEQNSAQILKQSEIPIKQQQNQLKQQVAVKIQSPQNQKQPIQKLQSVKTPEMQPLKTPDQFQLFLDETEKQKDTKTVNKIKQIKPLSATKLKQPKELLSPLAGQFLQQDYLQYDLQQLQLHRQIKKNESTLKKQINKTTSKVA